MSNVIQTEPTLAGAILCPSDLLGLGWAQPATSQASAFRGGTTLMSQAAVVLDTL